VLVIWWLAPHLASPNHPALDISNKESFSLKINATDSGGVQADYQIDWGDGTTPVTLTNQPTIATHTYASTGQSPSPSRPDLPAGLPALPGLTFDSPFGTNGVTGEKTGTKITGTTRTYIAKLS
jgi:hypothetical protein